MTVKLLIPDTQIPLQHNRAVGAVFEFIKDLKPEEIHQQGDLIDATNPSRWMRGTAREGAGGLQHELNTLDTFWSDLRSVARKTKVTYIDDANHCRRIEDYANKHAHAFNDLKVLNRETLFHLDKYDVEMVKAPYSIAPGTVSIHGERVRSKPGQSVLAEMERYGCSVVMGHVHRGAVVWAPIGAAGKRRELFGVEGGCLMDQGKAGYLGSGQPANWKLAVTILHIDGKDVHPVMVPINDRGVLFYQGKRYTG